MKFNMTNEQYNEYVKEKSPNSDTLKDCIFAFLIGGIICTIGQFVNIFCISKGCPKELASTLTSVIMIFIGSLLTGLNVYDDIAKYAGAGTIVPITGFANSIVSSAMEFKSEGYVMGLGAKMFTIAGPVIVFGVITSVVCGIIYFVI